MGSLTYVTRTDAVERGVHIVDPLGYYLKLKTLDRLSNEGELLRRDEKILRHLKKYVGIADRKLLIPFPEDVEARLSNLARRYPHAQEAIEAIHDALVLGRLSNADYAQIGASPLCLIGPPGSGKTTFALAVAKSIWGMPRCIHTINFPSLTANFELVGGDSQWESGDAGRIAKTMASSRFANPIFIADEVDKSSFDGARYGSPTTVLLHLLEKHTSRTFTDIGLDELKIDCSMFSWILTANDIGRIPKPILSRCRVIHVGYPKNAEQRVLVIQSIWADLREDSSWGRYFAEYLDEGSIEVLSKYPPREIRQLLEAAAARCVARQHATTSENSESVVVYQLTAWDVRQATRQTDKQSH